MSYLEKIKTAAFTPLNCRRHCLSTGQNTVGYCIYDPGPDLGGGPGPKASHHRGASHQTTHILFLANESADDFFALLQFASVTVY